MENRVVLLGGAVATAVLIGLFGALQLAGSEFLKLPAQWLAVGLLPVVFALFIGGYITRFKGFGVELEAALNAPVANLDLTAADAVADMEVDKKGSARYLRNLSEDKARSIRRLLFKAGRRGYYTSSAIEQYLRRLPYVALLEVRTEDDDILGFLPTSAVRTPDGSLDRDALTRFVNAVEEGKLSTTFPGTAITLRVQDNESLVEVLRKMRSERVEFAAVVTSRGRHLGVVQERDVERRVADSVLAAERAKN